MFGSFFKAALRNLKKHPGYSAINLFGLALGLSVALLILLFVRHEVSYDTHHDRPEDIYRIVLDGTFAGQSMNAPVAPAPMGARIQTDYPEVELSTRIFGFAGPHSLRVGDRSFNEDGIVLADSSVFQMFNFTFLRGDPETALNRRRTIVLTESLANRLFGNEDPLNQTIMIADTIGIAVTGVIADPVSNTHLQFSGYRSLLDAGQAMADQWISNNFVTYLRLRPGGDPQALQAKFPGMFETYAGPQLSQAMGITYEQFVAGGNILAYNLQPLLDIHLKSDFDIDIQTPGSMTYVLMFSAIAVFILLLACINFMNLATARSATRAREIGIRKSVGSHRGQLVVQFLFESSMMTVMSLVLAAGMIALALPTFNSISGLSLSLGAFFTPTFILYVLIGAALVSLAAGLYPALYLSSFDPAAVLKAETFAAGSRSGLRNALVVFQFAISISLLISTFVVRDQLQFIQNKRLGFDKEHIVVVSRGFELGSQYEAFKEQLKTRSSILAVGGANSIPGTIHGGSGYIPEGGTADDTYIFAPIFVDYDFVDAMGITMAEGRAFSPDFPSDSAAYMVNQAVVRRFGWDSGIGKRIIGMDRIDNGDIQSGLSEIVGVIEDYHFMSFRNEISGAVYQFANFTPPNILIRVSGNDMEATLAHIRETWSTFRPESTINMSFLNETFDNLAASDKRLGQLFAGFSLFAIIIAGLGLFGLGFFVTEQRTKEIGVRKALGASVREIVVLLSRDFTRLVLVALVLAIPAAWFGMSKWLDGFVYRTDLGIGAFALAGGLALAISWLTVSYQSIKAARANPIKALRHS